MNERMDGWMNEWMDGWMNKCMYEKFKNYKCENDWLAD